MQILRNLRQSFGTKSKEPEKLVEYSVTVKTGEFMWAGTNSTVQIILTGDLAVTKMHELDGWGDDHERGDTCKFSFKDINIGTMAYICLFLDKTADITDYWYVDYVRVKWKGKRNEKINHMFPIYAWITEDHEKIIFISSNKTSIPNIDTEIRKIARIHQTKKDVLHWYHCLGGFYGFAEAGSTAFDYESLDWNLKYHDSQDRDFYGRFDASVRNGNLQEFLSIFRSFDKLEDFRKVTGTLNSPDYVWLKHDQWKTDVEFGRQTLNGVNPLTIRKCVKLPSNFPLTNFTLPYLDKELEAGNIYIIDYRILNDVSTGTYGKTNIKLAAPICLFHVQSTGATSHLVPIAIQLGQDPGKDCPIWTPNDKPLDWLLAKMWFKNADVQIQHITNNTARLHMFLEPFAIAMYRCLPPVHPLYKLLKEHLQFAIGTNTIARGTLLSKVRLKMASAYQIWLLMKGVIVFQNMIWLQKLVFVLTIIGKCSIFLNCLVKYFRVVQQIEC